MQLMKDLYLVCGFPFAVHANVHAVAGKDGLLLFDTGTDEAELAIVRRNLDYWGLGDLPITDVFVTHAHMDHCGNAKILREQGARIIAGPGDAEGIEKGDDRIIDYALLKKFHPCPVDIVATDGMVVDTGAGIPVECFHVPGHSDGSLLFRIVLEGKKVLFTGDSIRVGTNCQSGIMGWTGGPDLDIPTYIQSLKRAARIQCDVLCGGHFQPCMQDGWKILQLTYKAALEDLRWPKNII